MLEKIGLPPKPSLRGNNWVVDATNCQGCSSQFTFINRKHHCRRCGGIFCNNCTQLRMVLRGQGDSPVRICEPCKKLEEASRFEMRYGHRNRAGRGGSKLSVKSEDEVLNEILSSEGKPSVSSRSTSTSILTSDKNLTSGASGSNVQGTLSQDEKGGIHRTISTDQSTDLSTAVNANPEELRQQAVEEKKKYKTLKAEGKPEEALRAFKRGKELEREAAALELNLRKNRRKALSLSNPSELLNIKNDAKASSLENKPSSRKNKEKDDLTADLRELGWSDVDFHEAESKPATISLEGELSKLLGQVAQGADTENGTRRIDKSQVNAHKRKALELKRQGKLAEAKEELKKAKVLEKEIEEQELLGEAEDSDEEFSLLVRSLNFDKHEDSSMGYNLDQGFDFDSFGGLGEDLRIDDDLEVTREDMQDPDMLATLQSLGWTEETTYVEDSESNFEDNDTEALVNEIQSLKKEALNQKRAGNSKEALALFRKAKLLEKELEGISQGTNLMTDKLVVPAESLEASMNHGDVDVANVYQRKDTSHTIASKGKSAIQRELLGLKKRALALRREGKLDEAEEELKKGKVLEKQLEELENASMFGPASFSNKHTDDSMITDVGDEQVTDQDMNDPTYLSLLKGLGWSDDMNENHAPSTSEKDVPADTRVDGSNIRAGVGSQVAVSKKSKTEIQRELLGLKRKSLALRRQGETIEAEEVLKKAERLEAQLAEFEASTQKELPAKEDNVLSPEFEIDSQSSKSSMAQSPAKDLGISGSVTVDRHEEMVHPHDKQRVAEFVSLLEIASQTDPASLKQDILAHKRKAVALKREGKLVEAKEELRQAKLLEKRLEENKSQTNESSGLEETNETQPNTSSNELSPSSVLSVGKKDSSPNSAPKTLSSRDRFKLQQESLNHKRQALKLRREGRTEEADAEFEMAKAIEAQLEESSPSHDSSMSQNAAEAVDDVGVEDFLDPQLFSALKAIGLDDVSSGSQVPGRREPRKQVASKIDNSNEERLQLEEQIKAEKVKALNFKRSGKQAEALGALRTAKLLEKKLNSLTAK